MKTLQIKTSPRRQIVRLTFSGVLLFATLVGTGCQHNVYRPDTLPLGFRASPVVNASDLSLARFDTGTANVNTIYPGDVLKISIVTGADPKNDPDWRLRVGENGALALPEIGPISVAGLDILRAEHAIASASIQRNVFRRPVVTVTIDARRTYQVTVDGAVAKPGNYELASSNCDLTAALLAAGGLTDEAGTIVELRQKGQAAFPDQPTPTISQASYQAPANQGDVQHVDLAALSGNDTGLLGDGAVVTVLKRPKPEVDVVGLVKRSGKVEIPSGSELRLLDALTISGGVNTDLANKVEVIRKHPETQEHLIIATTISQAKRDREWNLRLAPGDVVSVEDTPLTFAWRSVKDLLGTALLGVRIYTGL